MKKLLLVSLWLPTNIVSLILCLILLNSYSNVKAGKTLLSYQAKEMIPKNGYQFYAALPQVLGSFSVAVAKQDARSEIIRQFLAKHNSPFEPYAELITGLADEKNIDFRMIPAIGMCESNLGKKMPEGSFNAFGYAIYTGKKEGAIFDGWEHALTTMATYLREKYYNKGLTTPEEIGPIYAPPSIETGNSWAKCVRSFMDELI